MHALWANLGTQSGNLFVCVGGLGGYLVTAGPGEGPGDESQRPGLDPLPRFPELPWEPPEAAGSTSLPTTQIPCPL